MLPSELISIYREYKRDTDAIAAWLASSAKSAGFPSDQLVSPAKTPVAKNAGGSAAGTRLKGKARAEAKKQAAASSSTPKQPPANAGAKYIISIRNFTTLAEYLLEKALPVPKTVKATLDRVIAARTGFESEFEKYSDASDEDKAATHGHFVSVLKHVRQILTPLIQTDEHDQLEPETERLTNRFAGLDVYEPSEKFINAPIVERPTQVKTDPVNYEAESLSSLEDAIFALTALINDMNRMRSRIRWIWSNHKTGSFDLASAAVATNTAVDLVRNMIDDVMPVLETHGGFRPLLHQFYIVQCLQKGLDPSQFAGSEEFFYATYDVANNSYFGAYRLVEAFIPVIKPDQVPLYKEGMFGYYDPTSDRSKKTCTEKFEDDRALLMPFFTELMTIIQAISRWPVEDEFLRGIRELDKTKTVPFYAVFAAQVFLDITYALGPDIEQPWKTMMKQTTVISKDIKLHFDFHGKLKLAHWSASNDKYLRNVCDTIEWIGKDPLLQIQNELFRIAGAPPRETGGYRVFRMSPVMCGLMLYYFRSKYHEIGLTVADAWGSIQYSEHLYNALLQNRLLSGRWADMDLVRNLLSYDSFYTGGALPETPGDQFKKFCLQMGVSAATLTNGRRKNTPLTSKSGPRGIKDNSPVQRMFRSRYADNGALVLTTEQLHQICELSMFELETDRNGGSFMGLIEDPAKLKAKMKLHHQANSRPQHQKPVDGPRMAAERMIELLTLTLNAETVEFAFPYLHMHRWCWRLLQLVRESCDATMRQDLDPKYIERDSELPYMVGHILMLASGAGSVSPTMTPLAESAIPLKDMIESGAGNFVISNVMGSMLGIPVTMVERPDGDGGKG